ncbi:MAG: glycine cleavage system aminomethyltransferase GcvT, partial [Muribaculaceae bacterium]|nr:glycine cleavage system aminomethyltransferase GcvT [Muribaculaceae bacterium]
VYKRAENSYLLVINASNIDKDVAWMLQNSDGYDVKIENRSDELGEIAVQGPEAETILQKVLGVDLAKLQFYTFDDYEIYGGKKAIISRTGYTGEDGFEVYTDHETTRRLWDDLLAAGAKPCGLGCRDTLRFEVGLPLYGDELADDITPVEACLSMFCKLDKDEFIGKEAIAKQKAEGASRKSVGLEILDRAIARHGAEVLDPDGNVIGMVTTGYRGISVDKSIAVALIDSRFAARDTQLSVKVRRKVFPAVVVPKRFYKKSYKK